MNQVPPVPPASASALPNNPPQPQAQAPIQYQPGAPGSNTTYQPASQAPNQYQPGAPGSNTTYQPGAPGSNTTYQPGAPGSNPPASQAPIQYQPGAPGSNTPMAYNKTPTFASPNSYVSPTDLYVQMSGGTQRVNTWVGFLQEDPMKMYTGKVTDDVTGWDNPDNLSSYEILTDMPVPVSNSYNFYSNRGSSSRVPNNPDQAPPASPAPPASSPSSGPSSSVTSPS